MLSLEQHLDATVGKHGPLDILAEPSQLLSSVWPHPLPCAVALVLVVVLVTTTG